MVELSEVVGLGLVIFGTLSLLYGIALCYTVKVSNIVWVLQSNAEKFLWSNFVRIYESRIHDTISKNKLSK